MNQLFVKALLLGSLLASPFLSYGSQLFRTNIRPDQTHLSLKGVIYSEWRTAHRFCITKGFDAGASSYSTKTHFDRIRRTRKVKIDKVRCATTQRELRPDALKTRRAYYKEKKMSHPTVKRQNKTRRHQRNMVAKGRR